MIDHKLDNKRRIKYCDRLWAEWQKDHPSEVPGLSGIDSIMDPWTFTDEDTRDTLNLGYEYV
ncbi:hypothetical protein [Candidatus Nitrosocosmicus arcticus]|uniref:Uncharacterized protein n=1 Tax=Candidatus Nitrosocosmicus arcticus TaxID=2035267 RepID=A0A557STY2_9ARCH|nr:hypothetical protein [Candidatus Nitrosocosmicus arcticus]TVP40063.1 hypothetical protein NARC_100125 [Candidatus Nitrosocosmicus arcticus]